jgi:ribosomal protein L16 Arg81 hydroxylase
VGTLSFADITSPVAADDFLARYWTRRAVHLRDARRTFDDQFGWPALNALLNSGDLTYPTTVVSREERVIPADEFTTGGDGRTVNVAAVMKLFREGASFSIRGADSHWPPLKSIIACLYDTLFETVHTNVYCSPANTQGFRCHYDLHEVFVLQIEGTKHWKVFDPTTDFPVEPWKQEDVPDASATPYIDVVLGKGDVLYVPRGHWHYAIAQDSPSLHITVGVTCRKGETLLDWLATELRAQAGWRRNVPAMGGPTADGRLPESDEFTSWFNDLRTTLREALDDPAIAERFAVELYAATSPTVTAEMPLDGTAEPLPFEELVFVRPLGQRHVVSDHGDGRVAVRVAGTEIELEGISRDLLARVFSPEPFTLEDLVPLGGGVSTSELTELLETLIRSGLLLARPRAPE